ncbi:Na+/H+ antiporter subunit E [Pararhizobium haloflavum]|uniref:Na+/H+ antiporter subunit E n=1 Tax=Pararhizobium haloflavum TaxID=2037914 RepID=UPI000C19517F|nr:Na+/H+ antiporter subunit E [Pararhizobium haloflavum]
MTNLPSRLGRSSVLFAIFVKELVLSSVTVARQVLFMPSTLEPAIIEVPIELRTKTGATMLANCVTLTPGTTSLHVSEDLKSLYVHVLHAPDREAVAAGIKNTFEARIKEIEA